MALLQNTYIERFFWQQAIVMLSSGNQTVEKVVRIGARLYPILERARFPLKALFWAVIGLSLGLGIGILIG